MISGSLDLDLASPLFTDAPPDARTIVITREAARPELRAAAAKAADVIVAGQDKVDLAAALAALADRGLSRVNCEGGPHLLSQVAAAGLLDELTLTVSPTLAGPGAGRIVAGPRLRRRPDDPRPGADRRRLPLLPVPDRQQRLLSWPRRDWPSRPHHEARLLSVDVVMLRDRCGGEALAVAVGGGPSPAAGGDDAERERDDSAASEDGPGGVA